MPVQLEWSDIPHIASGIGKRKLMYPKFRLWSYRIALIGLTSSDYPWIALRNWHDRVVSYKRHPLFGRCEQYEGGGLYSRERKIKWYSLRLAPAAPTCVRQQDYEISFFSWFRIQHFIQFNYLAVHGQDKQSFLWIGLEELDKVWHVVSLSI